MAYTAGNLYLVAGAGPGRNRYDYDCPSGDDVDDVEAAGYFNNFDDGLNLRIRDRIDVYEWSGVPHAAGSILTNAIQCVVTNAIANDAAGATRGQINLAQVFLTTSLFSSLL